MTDSEKELHSLLTNIRDVRLMAGMPSGLRYAGAEDYLLQNAKFYAPPTHVVRKLMTPNACFDNAFKRARSSGGKLRYCEGYATSVIPLPHAWCIDREDRVVELTWRTPGVAYFGAVFDLNDVRAVRKEGCTSSMLQDNYGRFNPCLEKSV